MTAEPVETQERRRTVTWTNQAPAPVNVLVGLRHISAESGRARIAMQPAEYHYNPLGSVHGGIIATLAEAAMACAVESAIPPGRTTTTLEIKVNYLRALTLAAGEVVCDGNVVHAGRRTAMAEARVTDAAGRLYAVASATCLLSGTPPAGPPPDAGQWAVEWSDPSLAAREATRMAGLDYLQGMAAGRLPPPPAIRLLGISLDAAEPDGVTMTLPPGAHLHGPSGAVHGGMIATLLDSVMGCSVHATLPSGQGYTTLEIKVTFLHPVTSATGPLIGVGHMVHAGPQMAAAEGQARDASGRLHAIASTTCLVFSLAERT
jgi:uncharacterized protein (TIGR00369 family)